MLRKTRSIGDGADGESSRRSQEIESALVASANRRQDDASLTFEACAYAYQREISRDASPSTGYLLTLRSTIDERLQTLGVLGVDQIDQCSAHPPPSVDRIEATDDHIELKIVIVVLVLDLAVIAASQRGTVSSTSVTALGWLTESR